MESPHTPPPMESPHTPYSSPVAVITGAGGGLGRVFAQALAAEGWSIAALGRTSSSLQKTLDSLVGADELRGCDQHSEARQDIPRVVRDITQDEPPSDDHSAEHYLAPRTKNQHSAGKHISITCDVSDEHSVATAFNAVINHYGRLDLLINNAGVPGPTGQLHTVSSTEFRKTIDTNLVGTFLCTHHAFRWMARNGGGRIINNGSIAAHAPRAAAAAYAASKAAVASLTVSTSLDGRDYGITCTELDIGNARTSLLGSFTGNEPMFDAQHAARMLVAVASLPCDVSVDQLTVTATGMPYLGRG
ncbi:SDR family oxidoreductase [Corynebacterium anserum]|uniref:SDR family oxidoreductase n=1 Tax=Corynebacterium anserum TaxID=2684406 RepID=UPI0021B0551A|nr:SDR family oxidoreductase [Corynebacterium anserum]